MSIPIVLLWRSSTSSLATGFVLFNPCKIRICAFKARQKSQYRMRKREPHSQPCGKGQRICCSRAIGFWNRGQGTTGSYCCSGTTGKRPGWKYSHPGFATLFAVAEAYPVLRASENLQNLQGELAETENKIAYAHNFTMTPSIVTTLGQVQFSV